MQTGQAINLLNQEIKKHSLVGWTGKINKRFIRCFGQTRYMTRQILLSSKLVEINDEKRVMLTIWHEIAHALTPMKGHGRAWQKKCLELGGDGRIKYSSIDTNLVGYIHLKTKEVKAIPMSKIYAWTNTKGERIAITERPYKVGGAV